jgi:hypothetical protein
MTESWLAEFLTLAQQRLALWRKNERSASWSRLMTFGVGAFGWIPFRSNTAVAVFVIGVGIVAFVLSIRFHLRCRRRRLQAELAVQIADEARQRHGGEGMVIRAANRPELPDELDRIMVSQRTMSLGEQEIDDLDLYAEPVGLFGLLNRTSTAIGAARLREWLEHPCHEVDSIRQRQEAVQWLETHNKERMELMAACACLRSSNVHTVRLLAAVRSVNPEAWPPTWLTALRLWSIISAVVFAGGFVALLVGTYWVGTVMAIVAVLNTVLFNGMAGKLHGVLQPWKRVSRVVEDLRDVAMVGSEQLAGAPSLAAYQRHFDAMHPVLALLRKKVAWSDAGGMFHLLTNYLLFYDAHVATAILQCVVPGQRALLDGAAALAECEALSSLACFAAEQPHTCYPQPQVAVRLSISQGRHPLVAPDTITPNDVHLDASSRVWIVTGSNMAGKSTFLRMAATQVLLGQVGTVALADSMHWSPMMLLTDLRIRDNVARDESYFMAEVRQLRRMVKPAAEHLPLFGLIDEPFRGTNSDERVAASIALVQQLAASDQLFIVATHEQALTELANDETLTNWHFREAVSGTGEVFDHILRAGPAEVRNALRIMAREGYPPEMIAAAQNWMEKQSSA